GAVEQDCGAGRLRVVRVDAGRRPGRADAQLAGEFGTADGARRDRAAAVVELPVAGVGGLRLHVERVRLPRGGRPGVVDGPDLQQLLQVTGRGEHQRVGRALGHVCGVDLRLAVPPPLVRDDVVGAGRAEVEHPGLPDPAVPGAGV